MKVLINNKTFDDYIHFYCYSITEFANYCTISIEKATDLLTKSEIEADLMFIFKVALKTGLKLEKMFNYLYLTDEYEKLLFSIIEKHLN